MQPGYLGGGGGGNRRRALRGRVRVDACGRLRHALLPVGAERRRRVAAHGCSLGFTAAGAVPCSGGGPEGVDTASRPFSHLAGPCTACVGVRGLEAVSDAGLVVSGAPLTLRCGSVGVVAMATCRPSWTCRGWRLLSCGLRRACPEP